ncbi:MAG: DUF3880 domain-containing protein [Eubacterium sp.]
MKILMIRWKSICEPDIIQGFMQNGIDIETWYYSGNDVDYDVDSLQKIADMLMANTYDFVFSVDFFPVVARACNIVKCIYASWSVDCPVMQYYSKTVSLPYNRIFLFDYAMYQEFLPQNPNNIFYLPLGAAVDHFDEVIAQITTEDKKKYASDISFIGSTYQEKCKYNELTMLSEYTKGYAEALIEMQLQIYGANILEQGLSETFLESFLKDISWEGMPEDYQNNPTAYIAQMVLGEKVTEQERLRLLKRLSEKYPFDIYTMSDTSSMPKIHNKGSAESRIEMPKIFYLSKINLNMTSKTIRTGIPQRLWDIMGSGGFALTNYQQELEQYFELGKDLETYSSFEECEQKIAYYLSHEEERKNIAKNGYQKVCGLYTYRQRVADMLEILKETKI